MPGIRHNAAVAHIGQTIAGKYEIVELAGEGGMATVWRGVMHGAAGFTRPIAIKKIRAEYRAIRHYIDMFVEEARVGSELAHPNIVAVIDFCQDEAGAYYLIMEWIEGVDLGTFLHVFSVMEQPVPWPIVCAIGIGVLRALQAAHERRRPDGSFAPVIHRDVSPHNVLLGQNGIAKLTDFGLARARDRMISLTAPGTVKGKLSYLSPEVSYGQVATPLSDVFSLGIVLWESLVGERLFEAGSDVEVFNKIRACEIPSIVGRAPHVPAQVAEVVERALRREPGERYLSASQLAGALADVLRPWASANDAQTTLGNMVLEVKKHRKKGAAGDSAEDQPTSSWNLGGEGGRRQTLPPNLKAGSVEISFSDASVVIPSQSSGIDIAFSEVEHQLPDTVAVKKPGTES